jgi:hypothetical protein
MGGGGGGLCQEGGCGFDGAEDQQIFNGGSISF